jgi:hypothetical protein
MYKVSKTVVTKVQLSRKRKFIKLLHLCSFGRGLQGEADVGAVRINALNKSISWWSRRSKNRRYRSEKEAKKVISNSS